MRRLTASSLSLAEKCPASHALPATEEPDTDAQIAGTGRHLFLSQLVTLGREAALAAIPQGADWREACAAIDEEQLLAGVERVEPDLAHVYLVALDAALPIEVNGHRAYPASDAGTIPGTLDWLVERDGVFEVIDFKGEMSVAPAKDNPQLLLYALHAARARGLDEVGVAVGNIQRDGDIEWNRAHLDAIDLALAAGRIARISQRVTEARAAAVPDTVTGSHCTWCPALRACPAHITLVRELVADERPPVEIVDGLVRLSDVDAGIAWARLQRMKAVVEAMESSLRARVLAGPVPLPDGSELVAMESHPRSLVVDKALPVLEATFGAERLAAFVKRSIPGEVVGKLGRELAGGKGVQKSIDGLWSKLEAAGAVKSSTVTTVRARKVKAVKAGGAGAVVDEFEEQVA